MLSLKVRRLLQTRRAFTERLLLCFFAFVLTPGFAQTDRHIDKLIRQLEDYKQSVREKAAIALVQIGKPAVEPLVASLSLNDCDPRPSEKVNVLVQIGEPAVETLISALNNTDPSDNENVPCGPQRALVQVGGPALAPLIAAMSDQSLKTRWRDAQLLGDMKDPSAVEPLITALRSSDAHVRQSAVEALGMIKDPRAAKPLIVAEKEHLEDSQTRREVEVSLIAIGAPAVDPLIATLQDKDANIRALAPFPLGRIRDPRAVESLIAALDDSDVRVRKGAIWSLGEIGDLRAVDPVIRALANSDPDVRRDAVVALGRLNDPREVESLITALKDSDSIVQENSVEALGKMKDPRAVESLRVWAANNIKPINFRLGLWSFNMTASAFGNAITSSFPKCIIKENLDGFSVFGVLVAEEKGCTRTVVGSTGSKFKVKLHCETSKPDGKIEVEDGTAVVEAVGPDSAEGTIQWAKDNTTINISFRSTYIGPVCGSVK